LAEGKPVCGFDVNPVAQKWLDEREMGLNAFGYGMPATFGMITFWDTIEHVPNAREYLAACRDVVCISLPVFDQLEGVEKSKHYKPNEHLYYFTPWGLIGWMAAHGFRLLEYNRNETTAGRENIGAFAFQRIK